ncbi:hypothetical protein HPB51_005085 [Rhipicephalus microplus]|uniref:Uncharacterized protein n=1 Tax=Rhipicephalus microplus TaxID=6941 RepID=A0A9J6DL97_RHIMP|nr:hypothetical protein HPB51_005085 [Rhipicephalus microplus]
MVICVARGIAKLTGGKAIVMPTNFSNEYKHESKGTTLAYFEEIVEINNTSTEGLSLKEARKLLEASKERLQLVLQREDMCKPSLPQPTEERATTQNLYVQQPTRADDKNNLSRSVPSAPERWECEREGARGDRREKSNIAEEKRGYSREGVGETLEGGSVFSSPWRPWQRPIRVRPAQSGVEKR